MAAVVDYYSLKSILTPHSTLLTPRNYNRFKAFLLPLLVPVTVFCLADGVGDVDIVEGEVGEGRLKGGLVEQLLLHIAF